MGEIDPGDGWSAPTRAEATGLHESHELTVTVGEPQTIAKAVVAGTGALATAITTALADGQVTVWEIVLGVLLAAGSAAAVWATSNKP